MSKINVSGGVVGPSNPLTVPSGGVGVTSYAVGDMLYASGATAISKLPIGTLPMNEVCTGASGLPLYINPATGMYGYYVIDDYVNTAVTGDTAWAAFNSGTGAAQAKIAGEQGHPGILQVTTGTTTTGRSGQSKEFTSLLCGGGHIYSQYIVRFTTLSTAAQEYVWRAGCGDQTGNAAYVDGFGWEYDRATNGNFWMVTGQSNSSKTSKVLDGSAGNPTFGVTTGVFYRLTAIANAAGTQIDFYGDIVGSYTETLLASITTNIPTATGREFGMVHGIFKTAGTTGMTYDIDYAGHGFGAAR